MEKKIMHWLDVEEIASQLEENYHDEYVPHMKLLDLQQMITSLSDFEDHEVEVQRATLEEIRDKWEEIREGFNEEDTD
ncbi:Fe-S cluster assembly protein IscX [Rickettsia endosymbiont of Orchestes rusci]|jgi:FeS assembly protein IscX|uniref:Fe-S cluster assembly protein IscX n=1 Tax=Rickettsia endosymbiont of Orchestes rusci TaxID=3066250 RepID=UPI00313E2B2B